MVKNTAADVVLTTLVGRKRGISAKQIAAKTGKNLRTVRRTLFDLQSDGLVVITGTLKSGGAGRPAYLYVA